MTYRTYNYTIVILTLLFISLNAWGNITLNTKQRNFISFLLPKAKQVNQSILKDRQQLELLYEKHQSNSLTQTNINWLKQLAEKYDINNTNFNSNKTWTTLLKRVDHIPLSLILAQAANESAWGTSRFAKQGNNYFGEICLQQGCGIVPRRRDTNTSFEVKRYPSALASVKGYIKNLNTNKLYQPLRQARFEQRIENEPLNSIVLAEGLTHYSIIGERYVTAIQGLIRNKKLKQYD